MTYLAQKLHLSLLKQRGCGLRKKRRRQKTKQVAKQPAVISVRRWKPLAVIITIGSIFCIAVVGGIIAARSNPKLAQVVAASPVLTSTGKAVDSLDALLSLPNEQLSGIDIALVNLLCAKGLPGAEKLDIPHALSTLDQWAKRVAFETDRHLYKFRQSPNEYENSEGYFRMLMLITVLQQDLGVHYDPARIHDIDFTHSENLFIHGMIPMVGQSVQQTNGGTCVSMPVIYTAIARRLGYPVKLVTTKAHVFCRWDAPEHANPAFRGRFNIEATNQGMNSFPDDYYKTWPYQISDAEIKANRHLESLRPAEELAEFLTTRGHCLLDTGKTREALDAYSLAVKLCPSNALLAGFRHDAIRKLNPSVAQVDMDLMYPTRRRSRPVDPMLDVERINAINRANMERRMRLPTPGTPQQPGTPLPYQSRVRFK